MTDSKAPAAFDIGIIAAMQIELDGIAAKRGEHSVSVRHTVRKESSMRRLRGGQSVCRHVRADYDT